MIHYMNGKDQVRRADLVQAAQATGCSAKEFEDMIKNLHTDDLIKVDPGRSAKVTVA